MLKHIPCAFTWNILFKRKYAVEIRSHSVATYETSYDVFVVISIKCSHMVQYRSSVEKIYLTIR